MKIESRYLSLAAIDGLVSFFVLAAVERIAIHYSASQNQIDMQRGPVGYILQLQPFWNATTLVLHVGLFLFAAFVLHRYFLKRLASGLLFWVAVACAVTVGWLAAFLFQTTFIAINAGRSPLENVLGLFIYRTNQRSALTFLVAIIATNILFGAVVQFVTKNNWRRQPRYS